MSDDLLRETNELMKRLLDLRAEEDKRRKEAKIDIEKYKADLKFPAPSDIEKHGSGMQTYTDAVKKKSEETMDRHHKYQDALIAELRRQNALLERIAELLER